ncbi:MAG: radical SAM protein [Rhodanobacter sp.]
MGPTGDVVNVIQIHPTLRCNLRCQHCYSTSGPEQKGELALDVLERFLVDAAAEGYNAIGLSGGEPLTWKPLPKLLASARALGFTTSVTSNGLLLDARRLALLTPHLALLAISLDGVPASHNRMRAHPRAFEQMRAKLDLVRAAGLPFGFIFTLTLNNLDELGWVVEFACAEGAKLLQIHPLEQVGRARDYQLQPPDDLELSYAFLEVARLQERYRDRITLQFDVADRQLIAREPCRAFAGPAIAPAQASSSPLAALVSPLVVQEDGWVVPIQHGFARAHAIAQLDRGAFRTQAAQWKSERYPRFVDLAHQVWTEMGEGPAHLPFTNWYGAITTASGRRAAARPVATPVQLTA